MEHAEIKQRATRVAAEMKSHAGALPDALRSSFIEIRTALFQRGIYDPVLVRFDSATVPQASTAEIAEQLESVAATL